MFKNETICAVATGMGRSAIGIIRVSGPEAIRICDEIFEGKRRIADMSSFSAAYGHIIDRSADVKNKDIDADTQREDKGIVIDEVIVLVMKAPHTYTTEDTVEIDVHGGPFVIKKIMELLIKNGVRVAEPGEFTKRAFLGGRIDMTEAEAVMDVISAETDRALIASVNQLSGKLRDEIIRLREKLLYQTAYIESALDDPENYSLDGFSDTLRNEVEEVEASIDKLISTADEGRIIREGIRTAIVGKPNVGKSSMLNSLLGEERAIVTEIEGTTRDTLEEYIDIGGVLLKLIDTAGIHDTEDKVEKIGVDKAKESIENADLVLMLLDAANDMTDEDINILKSLSDKNAIIVMNKIDVAFKDESKDKDISEISGINPRNRFSLEDIKEIRESIPEDAVRWTMTGMPDDKNDTEEGFQVCYVSAKTGEGIDELKSRIKDMFFRNKIDYNDQLMINRARHKAALVEAKNSLDKVLDGIGAGMPEDFLTIDMMAAYEALGEIIGETLEDDLANKIFSDFCMGK